MKAYKLTDSNGKTKNNTQWGEGVTHTATGEGSKLCSNGLIHFYTNPLIAMLLNPIHANFDNPILWECETSGIEMHEPLKSGCKTLTTVKRLEIPVITITQKVTFGILCALTQEQPKNFIEWANSWLDGTDRTASKAATAADTASKAASKATTTYSAAAAAYSATAAYSIAAAVTAATATAAYSAATATAYSAATGINFVKLAEKALTYS